MDLYEMHQNDDEMMMKLYTFIITLQKFVVLYISLSYRNEICYNFFKTI